MAIWVLFVSLTFSFSSSVIFVNAVTDPSDVSSLNVLYTSLNLPSQLTGWIPNGGDPCGESWKGITCVGSSVVGISSLQKIEEFRHSQMLEIDIAQIGDTKKWGCRKLSGMELTGTLGYMMNSMTSLIELDLSSNSLGDGTQIPFNLPPNLHRLNLAGNKFNGVIPYSISQMVSLNYLNLNHNQLEGNLNDMFGKLSNLSTMDLSFNSLSGDLPASFSALSNLTNLYLQNNQFTGTIDVLADLPLLDLNAAENHFTGWIPNQLKGIRNLETSGNSWSFGPSPPSPPVTSPQTRRIAPGHKSGSPKNPSTGAGNDATSVDKSSGISTGVITGIIISVLAISAVVAFFLIRQRHRKTYLSKAISKEDHTFKPFHTQSAKGSEPIQLSPATISEALQETSSTTLKPPPNRQTSFDDENTLNSKKASTASIKGICYSVADLQSATDSFSMSTIVGEGSIGRVFRASFSDGKVLAVKKLNSCFLHNQSTNDFIAMVSNISNMHHPNISELVGYCSEHGQNLLVYDFYKNGSLYDALHHIDEFSKPLEWNMRVKIALGTARALEYLHEVCSPSIIHKNFKSANILLDGELNPRLSDCELASFNPAFSCQALDHSMNSGYIAPEVTMTGLYSLKSDVYSFGVVMLELLTGRKAFDSSRSRSEQCLVQWATPQLHDIDALDKMVDPSLEGLYPAKTLSRFADVIALCVQAEPEFRPPMSEVVQSLVRLLQRAHMSKRTRSSERLDGTRRVNDV